MLSSRGGFSSGASPRKLDSGGRGIRPSPPAPWLDGSGTRTRYGLKKGRRASPRVFPGRPVGFGKTQLGSNLHPPQGYLGGPGRAPRPRARRGRLPRPRREVSGGDGPFTRRRDTSIYLDVYVRRPWGVLERPQPHASLTLVGTGVGWRPLLRDLTDLRRRGC
ncbi:hypothetical protein ROHU_025840 [Labeo rohita]|uniref:Uncharacterized protein n=1 Tax=Labeo rohita TaxID=84645 RepID=A0A498MKN5_LABRO|nr:hypothetical protein ROHU_025840 [Labeo rohita]